MAEYQFDHSLSRETWARLDAFTRGYIECAFWTLTDEHGESCDHLGLHDLGDGALEIMVRDCLDFQTAYAELLAEAGTPEQNGHDFWLTRNRHGAGFWDRGYPEALARRLTEAAHAAGSEDLYVGDDGSVYV